MAKEARRKLGKSIKKRHPPIIVVPDKTYVDDTGDVIPTDVLLITDPILYQRMSKVLEAWGKEQMGVPGKRGVIEG